MKKKNIKKAKVKAPLTVKTKQNGKEVNSRVYANTPHGFKKDDGATTQPLGTVMANNGKSLFATKPDGKPARKQVVVLKDKEAFRSKHGKQQKSETAGSKSSAKAAAKKSDKPATKTKTPAQKKSKKIEFGRLMPDGKVIKAKGDYYKTSNGIEIGISKDTNGRYYATELSTGKLVSLRTGDKSIVDAVNFVEKYSSEIKKAMDTNTQIPAPISKPAKQPTAKKAESSKAKSNNQSLEVTTYCINEGTPSQHFILKTTETDNSQVLQYAPNNWKTEKGALKWAKKNGFATPKATTPKPTVTKASKKATGKGSSASNNSVKTAITAKQNAAKPAAPKKAEAKPEKRRVYKSLPKGYSVVQGTVAQVDGTILIHNGKPLFKQNKDGTTQQAKDSHGKPAHKTAALIVDPQAFNEAKTAERAATTPTTSNKPRQSTTSTNKSAQGNGDGDKPSHPKGDKYLRKDEVRLYNNPKHLSKTGRGHPARITAKHKKAFKFNVFTHSDTFFGEPTLELADNPDKNPKDTIDKRPSRVSVPHWENEKSFSNHKLENWHLDKENKTAIKKWNKEKDTSNKQ